MKKCKLLVVTAIAALLFTGCGMKMNLDVKVDKDKNLTFSVIMALDDELIDSMLSMSSDGNGSSPTDKERWAYVEEAFKDSLSNLEGSKATAEKYDEGDFKGYRLGVPTASIDFFTKESASEKVNISDLMNGGFDSDGVAFFVKDGEKYVSNLTFDGANNESLSQMSSYSSSMDVFEMNFVITLPVKPESNNADKVSKDGKTLTWDLSKGSKDIDFTFDFNAKDDKDNTMLYIIGGAVAGVAVVAVAAVVIMNNKKKKVVTE